MLTTKQIHEAIRKAALAYWEQTIIDQTGSDVILNMYHRAGWHWLKDYRNGRDHWCGMFAGNCSLDIGDHIQASVCLPYVVDPDIALFVTPSTGRLNSERKWKQATDTPPRKFEFTEEDPQLIPWSYEAALIPGAIATIKSRGFDTYGGHIVIVDSYEAGADNFTTIEGNAKGLLGNGETGEGVIRTNRPISALRRVYHLQPEHVESL